MSEPAMTPSSSSYSPEQLTRLFKWMAAGDFIAGAALVAIGLYFEETVVSAIGLVLLLSGTGRDGLDDRPGQPPDPADVKYVVYGVGAVGGVIAGHLHRAGHDVTLVARGEHLAAIRARGLTLDTYEATYVVDAPATDTAAEVAWTDDTAVMRRGEVPAHAGRPRRPRAARARRRPPVLTAQNGVANEPAALRRFERTYGVLVMLPVDPPRAGRRRPEVPPGAGPARPRAGPGRHRRRRGVRRRRPAGRRVRVGGRGRTSWPGSTASC